MSQTSVGSETVKDNNENGKPDAYPSKTFGAESGPDVGRKGDGATGAASKAGVKPQLAEQAKAQAEEQGLAEFPPALPDRP